MNEEIERKFLHSIASPLAAATLLLKRALAELDSASTANPELTKTILRLKKIEECLAKIEELHANHKSDITNQAA